MNLRCFFCLVLNCVLCIITAQSSLGQPQLTLEADTLHYTNQADASNTLSFWNSGTQGLVIDSLRLGQSPTAWAADLKLPDTTYTLSFRFGYLEFQTWPSEMRLAPGDTARFGLTGLDPCVICKRPSELIDTLFIYVGQISANPTTAWVNFTNYNVATASGETRIGFDFEVYPNPAREQATIEFSASHTGAYDMSVYSLTGQLLHREHKRVIAGLREHVSWPVAGEEVASGVYLVVLGYARERQSRILVLRR